jgi:hypothetical protein
VGSLASSTGSPTRSHAATAALGSAAQPLARHTAVVTDHTDARYTVKCLAGGRERRLSESALTQREPDSTGPRPPHTVDPTTIENQHRLAAASYEARRDDFIVK